MQTVTFKDRFSVCCLNWEMFNNNDSELKCLKLGLFKIESFTFVPLMKIL